jgi:hypothetical protein
MSRIQAEVLCSERLGTQMPQNGELIRTAYEADRLLIWAGEPGWAGGRPDYRLDASADGCVTRSLHIAAVGEGWERRLRLERDPGGEWTAEVDSEGELDLPVPGGDALDLGEALDCDLGFSPLTNTMPVLRHRLRRRREWPGAASDGPRPSAHALA